MRKIRHLEPYGFNEQPQFDGLVNTVKANIENIKEKNQEQDKKDESQDENIKQAVDKSVVSLEMLSAPTERSCRTYAVKQGGNEIGKIEIPFSSLVKSTTYDAEKNLLIFTIDNDKDIKVNLTDLIEDADLVQRRIFDDFKNRIISFSSDTVNSISELNAATSNTSENIKELEQKLEDTSYTTAKALNKLNDDIEDAFDDIKENSIKIKNIEDNNSASNDSLNELSANVETFSSETENKINNLKEEVDNKSYVVSKSINDINDRLEDFEDDTKEKFTSIDKTLEDKSYVVSKAINELKGDLEDAIDESMVIRGTGENSAILKDSDSIAKGKNSLALGTGLVAENENEIALGKYNKSSDDTVFSFGIGTSESDRKNAVEIKNDGKIYLWSEEKYVWLNEIIGRVDV